MYKLIEQNTQGKTGVNLENPEPGRKDMSRNELINIIKGLYAKECHLEEKNKTLLSASFGFQHTLCQQLVVKQSGGGKIKCTIARLQWKINAGGKIIRSFFLLSSRVEPILAL